METHKVNNKGQLCSLNLTMKAKKSSLLDSQIYEHKALIPTISSTRNKNLPNLIILDPIDYRIVLILSLIT